LFRATPLEPGAPFERPALLPPPPVALLPPSGTYTAHSDFIVLRREQTRWLLEANSTPSHEVEILFCGSLHHSHKRIRTEVLRCRLAL